MLIEVPQRWGCLIHEKAGNTPTSGLAAINSAWKKTETLTFMQGLGSEIKL